jgi:hypothetical protein
MTPDYERAASELYDALERLVAWCEQTVPPERRRAGLNEAMRDARAALRRAIERKRKIDA